jgi:predicted DNA-binding transcriptional regulator AlpA
MLASRQNELAAILPPTRRGLSRALAADYVGVGSTKFDEMVSDGRMPKPKRIDGRKVWDRRALDQSFEALPSDGDIDNNPWDDSR